MKNLKTILFAIVLFLSIPLANAQSNSCLADIDRQVEVMLDSAAKHMVNFILTHKEVEYQVAMSKAKVAIDLNNASFKKATEQESEMDVALFTDRSDELKKYADLSLKASILKEKLGEGNVTVNYQGKSYIISEESRKLFYIFLSYLPR